VYEAFVLMLSASLLGMGISMARTMTAQRVLFTPQRCSGKGPADAAVHSLVMHKW
jgi:hypothetical protein